MKSLNLLLFSFQVTPVLIIVIILFGLSTCSNRTRSSSDPSLSIVGRQRWGRIRGGGGMTAPPLECNCRKYTPRIPRIIKGKPVGDIERIPWQARLERFNFKGTHNFDYVCSGVLVSSHFLITAGHCLATGTTKESYQVVLGTPHLYNRSETSRTYRVSDFVKHRGHHELVPNDNDIAILKIEDEYGDGVRCDMSIQPICLGGGPTFPPGSQCLISGWGATETELLSEKLLYAAVELHSHETCQHVHSLQQNHHHHHQGHHHDGSDNYLRRSFGGKKLAIYDHHHNRHRHHHITHNMLCAGPGPDGEDSCHGDSGGPLFCFDNQNVAYLTGITSWGKTCGTKASVYTKVSQYKDWIRMEMQLMG